MAKMYEITAPVRWAKLREDNMDVKYDQYVIDVKLDEEGLKTFQESGSRKQPKEDDGDLWVQISRKATNEVNPQWGGPPKVVLHEDGKDTVFTQNIGNESVCTVYFTTYPSRAGIGTRLEGVRIHELVEHEVAALPF